MKTKDNHTTPWACALAFSVVCTFGSAVGSEGPKIPVVPPEHPRLYLRAEHAARLAERLKDPVLAPVVEQLQSQARRSPQSKVEWDAVQYLVAHDTALGRATIEAALPLLQKCELADRQDACRETGRRQVYSRDDRRSIVTTMDIAFKSRNIASVRHEIRTANLRTNDGRQGRTCARGKGRKITQEHVAVGGPVPL